MRNNNEPCWTCPACKKDSGRQRKGRYQHCFRLSYVKAGKVTTVREVCCNCNAELDRAWHAHLAQHGTCKNCGSDSALDDWDDYAIPCTDYTPAFAKRPSWKYEKCYFCNRKKHASYMHHTDDRYYVCRNCDRAFELKAYKELILEGKITVEPDAD